MKVCIESLLPPKARNAKSGEYNGKYPVSSYPTMTMKQQGHTSTSLKEQHQEEAKSTHAINEPFCNGLLSCFGTAPMFDKTMNYCNAFSAGYSDFKKDANKLAKEASSFVYQRQRSIPSEVCWADLSKTNASADRSICKCVSKTTTFQTTDTTLYDSSYEQGTKDFGESSDILFQNSEHQNLDSASRWNCAHAHHDLVLKFSEVSALSCPSFSDQSFDAPRAFSEDRQLGGIHLLRDFEEMSIGVGMEALSTDSDDKDSLLSFENSSISGGSDAVLDLLSLESEEYGEEGEGHTRLSNLCEQSVQSSTRSDCEQFDESLNYVLR
jgi:hypothetical protein